jgi:hypothetical protein
VMNGEYVMLGWGGVCLRVMRQHSSGHTEGNEQILRQDINKWTEIRTKELRDKNP